MSKANKILILITLLLVVSSIGKVYAYSSYIGKDRVAHLVISTSLSYWNYEFSREVLQQSNADSIVYSVSLTALIGTGKELSDKYGKKTKFSWQDMVYNGAGIALGVIIAKNLR
jgi:uncharacterized protein YfiM (DUF2279 family)